MINFPEAIQIIEVGLRDGIQNEAVTVPTADKLDIIHQLVAAGVTEMQVTSFVHPEKVPQMADAEQICQQLPDAPGVVFSGLVLNRRGLERAHATGLRKVDIGMSASNTHSLKNTGRPVADKITEVETLIQQAKDWGMVVRAGLQCVFGCAYEGNIPRADVYHLLERYLRLPVDEIALADSTGMANPQQMQEIIAHVKPMIGDLPLTLHLHDTYGLGLANMLAAMASGVTRFDCSFGGLGGCPFIEGATGNIATEDVVYMLDSMGIRSGMDWRKVAAVSRRAETLVKHTLTGKLYGMS
ncbi:MAG: hydroxymethylglutaryl-CoA lyase [Anaerolineae bacterium]|nr:hydroxymethylglutaryl-CoA lyase [Anaerolineae bacterium]